MKQNKFLDNPKIRKVHFIGIGGSSMSGLAAIMKHRGYEVSGSDMKDSKTLQRLSSSDIKVMIGHDSQNIDSPDLVVFTVAVKEDNEELVKARELNIPIIDRAELLGELMSSCKYPIAVSGTHGKTTTTSMITMVLLKAGLDPTVHIGGELDAISGNTRIGDSDYFVVEACEYFESFLKFKPYAAVVLNIESDHLDYFRDEQHIVEVFEKFTSLVAEDGFIIGCEDSKNVKELMDRVNTKKIRYSINEENNSKVNEGWFAKNINFDENGHPSFSIFSGKEKLIDLTLSVPGVHNVSNAIAAAACCYNLGCSLNAIKDGLEAFSGTKKRFEKKGEINGMLVIDDYAHHPSEVKATISAALNYRKNKLWCVFQPHTYTRTKAFMEEFSQAFEDADYIIITDIYAAREKNPGDVNASQLAEKIKNNGKNVLYMKEFSDIARYLLENAKSEDMILTMGAGDIVRVAEIMLEEA